MPINFVHNFHFNRFVHNEYNDLVIADTLRQIALSMVSVFIPIYLLKINFSLNEVFLYLFLSYIGQIFAAYLATVKIESWSVKRVLIFSYLINIALYLILSSAEIMILNIPKLLFIFLIAVIAAIQTAFFWTAHHFYFLSIGKDKDNNSGSKTGILNGIPVLFGVIGPFLGGYLITKSGFSLVFMISALLLIMASMALFFSKDIKIKNRTIRFRKIIDAKRPVKNWIYVLQGIKLVIFAVSWPLIMYYLDISLVGIGSVYLLSNVVHSIFCYEAGHWSDRRGSRAIIQIGLFGHNISLVARGLISTIAGAGVWTTVGGVFGALNAIPLEADFYYYARKIRDYANANVNREFYVIVGQVFTVLFFFITSNFFSDLITLRLSMFMAALATIIMMMFVSVDKDLIK
ncbi:MAG: MFS transporter [Patescibacteria group bacterium]|nr:MFS transporter [Patescibacteria group bacterium]